MKERYLVWLEEQSTTFVTVTCEAYERSAFNVVAKLFDADI